MTSANTGSARRLDVGDGDPAANEGAVVALARKAQEHRAGHRLLRAVESDERVLGHPRDGPLDAAAASVGGEAQRVPSRCSPELDQRGGQQRERARPALDVSEERSTNSGSTLSPTR